MCICPELIWGGGVVFVRMRSGSTCGRDMVERLYILHAAENQAH